MELGKWRPRCYGREFLAWIKECKSCPFKETCDDFTFELRSDLEWKYRDAE